MATEGATKAGLNSIQFKEMDAEAINLPECDGKTDFIWIVEGNVKSVKFRNSDRKLQQ